MTYLAQLTIPGFDQPVEPPKGIPTGSFTSGLGNTILANSLNVFFIIAAILVLAYMFWGGIQWIMSGGDKQKLAAARNRILYAVIGLVVIALAIPLINLFLMLFGRELGS